MTDVFIGPDLQGVSARLVTCCLSHDVMLELSEWDCRGLSSVWAQQEPAHLPASQRSPLSPFWPTPQGTPLKRGTPLLVYPPPEEDTEHSKFATLCQTLVMSCAQVSDVPRSLAAP